MPIPHEKILEMAAKAGFDSELKVASILSASGWRASQSVYYVDKDERIGRELDIYASRYLPEINETPRLSCKVGFCIEVKKSADPFIFFSSEAGLFEGSAGYGMMIWRHNVDRDILDFHQIERLKPFNNPKRLGRAYMGFKDSGNSHLKAGLLSALKSAIHYTESCDERYNDESRDICFFLPIVIVDGQLFECYYEEGKSELSVQQVDSIQYLQNYASPEYGMVSHSISVLTIREFERILPDYAAWQNSILHYLKQSRNKHMR